MENGKLYVLGAALARWSVASFPATIVPVLAAVIEADRDLDHGRTTFVIRAVEQTGTELVRASVDVLIQGPDEQGWPWISPFVAPMQILVNRPGPIDVLIESGAGVEARIPMIVTPR